MQRKRIGVFGGTFDPVHVGHLVAASWCKDELGLDLMLLVVANEPWQKVGTRDVAPAEQRLAVVEASVEGVEGLEASRMEIDRGGPSYTADTVAELRGRFPGAEIYLVVGSDVAMELGTWHRIDEVSSAVTLVVVDRGGMVPKAGLAAQWGWSSEVHYVRMPTIEVSSSELRDRLREGRSVDFLIPAAGIRRIRELGMYSVER